MHVMQVVRKFDAHNRREKVRTQALRETLMRTTLKQAYQRMRNLYPLYALDTGASPSSSMYDKQAYTRVLVNTHTG